jgi:hypothetical protein
VPALPPHYGSVIDELPQEYFTRLVILFFDITLTEFYQGYVTGRITLYQYASGFIDY